MATDFTPLGFDQNATIVVELRDATLGSFTHLDGDTVADIQDNGVMVDYSGIRYFVPWSNVRVIRQALPS